VDQFASIVVALLAVAATISWATGERLEAIAILIVLVLNAIVGFLTEWQAGRALDALRRQARTTARVKRDHTEREIDAEDLVPGDLVILNAGDRVPADSRLLEAVQLLTQESALTGESTTVEKTTHEVTVDTPLAERRSMVYLGTAVAAGRAVGIVVNTGSNTELGRIGHLVSTSVKEDSPLEIQLGRLGHRVVYIVLAIAVIVMLVGWLRGDELWTMVEVGISLAVAAVPEGLPAVTTLILALGILRMSRRRAIIRRLLAVETLGSTTVICCDKTGTLTENRMTVREYFLSDGRTIDLQAESPSLENDNLLQRAVRIGVLSNEASIQIDDHNELQTLGDPTETALLLVADALVLDVVHERNNYPKIGERPFQTATRRMTTLHRRSNGQHFAALKGAPAVVLDACSHYVAGIDDIRALDQTGRERFIKANEQMAARALRVLALAVKHFEQPPNISDDTLESGYTFLGLVGMIDPPRPGVAEAIAESREAGIRVVMLTGDQLETALAIARELNLGVAGEPRGVHANALLNVDQEQLADRARSTDVFARVSPEDKLRIVEAMQRAGEIVAVTGDGVNDAPALKRANIGIAMGQRGTEVAKDAADVVLADDNFATIVYAVEGGRTIYANIRKFVHLMFTHNLGEVLMIFSATAMGWPLPLMPLQILWMNLVTDVFPALSLAMEPPSPNTMKRKPRHAESSLLSRDLIILISWQSTMLAATALLAYWWALGVYGPGEHARTIGLFTLIGVQLGHLFNCRSQTRSAFSNLFSNPYIWVATLIVIALQLMAVFVAPLSLVLGTTKPNQVDWAVLIGAVIVPILIVEITKLTASWRRETINL
jgi:Ca2+-transporting ATPase